MPLTAETPLAMCTTADTQSTCWRRLQTEPTFAIHYNSIKRHFIFLLCHYILWDDSAQMHEEPVVQGAFVQDGSGLRRRLSGRRVEALVRGKGNIEGGLKMHSFFVCLNFIKYLTDFQNYFTVRIRKKILNNIITKDPTPHHNVPFFGPPSIRLGGGEFVRTPHLRTSKTDMQQKHWPL